MSAWDEVTVGGGMSLLPAGIRTFEITTARAEVAERGNKLRQAVIGLASSAGSGEDTLPLEPFDRSPDGVELWERIFKSAASGLGFAPSAGNVTMQDAANEFAAYLPGLVGSLVEVEVKHVPSKKLKDNGEPFVNHRVTYRSVVAGSGTTAAAAPVAETVPSFADDDVWG